MPDAQRDIPPRRAGPEAPGHPAAQPAAAQPFNAEQLDALVASIALYPDDLLTQLLMASTFPLEVVTAARWVEDPAHKSLSGDALVKALEAEPWDPSVKSLAPFPVVLATLNSNLTWLQQLGYAFATQQADVFAAVQRLRRLAQANDKLQSSPQQVVSTQQVTVEPPAGSSQPPTQQEVIVIQPAQADTVYVPSYNPATVYGSSWPYPSYPPYYAAPPSGYYFGTALATGLAFAAGAAVVGGLWGWASPGWGGWRRLCQRQRQSIQQHQRQPVADHLEPLGRGRWGWAGRQRLTCARRTGWASGPLASLCSGQCGAASGPPGGCGRSWWRWRRRRCWSTWRSRRGGRHRWCWSARRSGGVGGWWRRWLVAWVAWECRPAGRSWWRGWRGGAGRPGGPGGVGGVGGAGRPGGPGGVGGVGSPGRPSGPGGVGGVGGAGRPGGPDGVGGVGRPGGPGGVGGAGGASRPAGGSGRTAPHRRAARRIR